MSDVSTEKKPFIFDKAKYRQKKYSHENKLNDWKKNHKINAERKYKKMLRKEVFITVFIEQLDLQVPKEIHLL